MAKKLGYRLNPLVSAHMAHLRGTRVPRYQATLAFVCNWPREAFVDKRSHIARYFEGARQRAHDLGYTLEAFHFDDPSMTAKRLDGVLRARGITGLVIAPLVSLSHRLGLDWSR